MPTTPKQEETVASTQFAAWNRRLQRSDRAAFAEVFEAMHTALLRYAWRYTGEENAARDIVQDAFLKLWHSRENLDPKRSLKAFLYTIVRNLALNHNRASQHHATPDTDEVEQWDDGDAPSIEEQLQATLLGNRLQKWMNEMPARRREAFMLSRFHGMSHEEIADVMNLTPRTVNTHIVLALRDLRDRLSTLEKDPTAS